MPSNFPIERMIGVVAAAVLITATAFGGDSASWTILGSSESLSEQKDLDDDDDEANLLTNWSGTHSCRPGVSYFPESADDVQRVLAEHHQTGVKLRVMGTGLSPNGIGLPDDGCAVLSLSSMDKILDVNVAERLVTVQAGVKVGDLCERLEPHGLTLQNLASIAEQQVGGFVSVGAHGTGAKIPPVDMQVVSLKLATPARGTVTLSESDPDPRLFHLAKVGLGALGVVTEVTLRCVPSHELLEHTYCSTRSWVRENHARLLRAHQHIRFMWIPYHDAVVVVTNDPVPSNLLQLQESANGGKPLTQGSTSGGGSPHKAAGKPKEQKAERPLSALSSDELRDLLKTSAPSTTSALLPSSSSSSSSSKSAPSSSFTPEEAVEPLSQLLLQARFEKQQQDFSGQERGKSQASDDLDAETTTKRRASKNASTLAKKPSKASKDPKAKAEAARIRARKALEDEVKGLGFSQLRDELLAIDPLNTDWVKQVNGAEAEFWRRSEGFRVGRNVDLLQFDCGGQQWVSEVCFPAGTLDNPSAADLEFMEELLNLIEQENIAAPSPIEQRWTANSDSVMSPACASAKQRERLQAGLRLEDTVHSWVGIIMYLPTDDPEQRRRITEAFFDYKDVCTSKLWKKFDAQEHWAKIELPGRALREAAAAVAAAPSVAKVQSKEEKKKPLFEVATSKTATVDLEGGNLVPNHPTGDNGEGGRVQGTTTDVRSRLVGRYPLKSFAAARKFLDSKGILVNAHITELLPIIK